MSTHCVTAHDDKNNMVSREIHLQDLIFAGVKGVSESIFVNCGKRKISVNSEFSPEVWGYRLQIINIM